MTLLPRSLFGRLVLLLVAVVALAAVITALLFRHDRAALLARQFSDTKIVQLQALRAALEGADGPERRETLARLGREYGVRIVPESERPDASASRRCGPRMRELEERLRERWARRPRCASRRGCGLLFVRVERRRRRLLGRLSGAAAPAGRDTRRARCAVDASMLALLLAAAFVFARYLARPLRELDRARSSASAAARRRRRCRNRGPSEIAAVNRGFNAMSANLRQIEHDRALLLAGVSHDLRTPLARLRLGIEMSTRDEATRAGMVDDIEEMDRIIGQFLDFARDDEHGGAARRATSTRIVARLRRALHARRAATCASPPATCRRSPLEPTAISRLVANLIDNALAYGAPPVEVSTTRRDDARACSTSPTAAPGIAPADVERLKQPFTRASAARARADGAAGAGLGLAIVDRIARLHGGTFDLLPRDGGGTIARVTLPRRRVTSYCCDADTGSPPSPSSTTAAAPQCPRRVP